MHTAEPRRGPKFVWFLITIIAGVAGAAGAIAVAGHGTYEIGPFKTELRAWPAPAGKTVLKIDAPIFAGAHAEAGTHRGPIDFKVTITGLSSAGHIAADAAELSDPRALATLIGDEGKDAIKSFAIRVGALALGGGLAGGLVISLGRWRRILGGALAGLLAVTIVGVVVQSSYNADEFSKTKFVIDRPLVSPSILPS